MPLKPELGGFGEFERDRGDPGSILMDFT